MKIYSEPVLKSVDVLYKCTSENVMNYVSDRDNVTFVMNFFLMWNANEIFVEQINLWDFRLCHQSAN